LTSLGRIGKYELLKRLAVGGMAEVFLARQTGPHGFEKMVVIKKILPHLAAQETFVRMFLDEARIAARFNHPNITQIYELGEHGHTLYIAMEHVHGKDLKALVRRCAQIKQRIPVEHVVKICSQILDGLHFAHTRADPDGAAGGVVHRDVTPHNIIVSFEGGVKLLDFGIAKARSQISTTLPGQLKGKFAYMSPEQCLSSDVDRRSDVFSVGIVMYELLTGTRLFKRDLDVETVRAITDDQVPPVRAIRPELEEELEQILERALERRREHRYQTAQEMQVALEDFLINKGLKSNSVLLSRFISQLFAGELAVYRKALDEARAEDLEGAVLSQRGEDASLDNFLSMFFEDSAVGRDTESEDGDIPDWPDWPDVTPTGKSISRRDGEGTQPVSGSLPPSRPAPEETGDEVGDTRPLPSDQIRAKTAATEGESKKTGTLSQPSRRAGRDEEPEQEQRPPPEQPERVRPTRTPSEILGRAIEQPPPPKAPEGMELRHPGGTKRFGFGLGPDTSPGKQSSPSQPQVKTAGSRPRAKPASARDVKPTRKLPPQAKATEKRPPVSAPRPKTPAEPPRAVPPGSLKAPAAATRAGELDDATPGAGGRAEAGKGTDSEAAVTVELEPGTLPAADDAFHDRPISDAEVVPPAPLFGLEEKRGGRGFMIGVFVVILAVAIGLVLVFQDGETGPGEAPATGFVKVTSVPSGADVHLDEVRLPARTPTQLDRITPNVEHKLKITMPGLPEWEQSFTLTDTTKPLEIKAVLSEVAAQKARMAGQPIVSGAGGDGFSALEIVSQPPGALIYLDGIDTGRKTPHSFRKVPAGLDHVVLVELADQAAAYDRVHVAPGSKQNRLELALDGIPETLEGGRIKLRFESDPAGATLVVNGFPLKKTTPVAVKVLARGASEIEIELAGHRTWKHKIRPVPGVDLTIHAKLKKK